MKSTLAGIVWLCLMVVLPLPTHATISNVDHANDICPPTANPCVLSETAEVVNGTVLDFGSRAFQIQGGVIDIGNGSVTIRCGQLTATNGGVAFQVRGPSPFGGSEGGLLIIEVSRRCSLNTTIPCFTNAGCANAGAGTCTVGSGNATLAGRVNASADEPGTFLLQAAGDVRVQSSIQANAQFIDGDGGTVEILATGSIFADATINTNSGSLGGGGDICLLAGQDVFTTAVIDASGGDFDGGFIEITGDRDVRITQDLRADATSGEGYGGEVVVSAGRDLAVVGGGSANRLQVSVDGHQSSEFFGGDGGDIEMDSGRNLSTSTFVVLGANGAPPDGFGGVVDLLSFGSMVLDGDIDAKARGGQAAGGEVTIEAFDDLELRTDVRIDVTGSEFGGGTVDLEAGLALTYAGTIDASGTNQGFPGEVTIFGADQVYLSGDILIDGISIQSFAGSIDIDACRIEMLAGASIDNRADGGRNIITAHERITVHSGAALLADGATGGINRIRYRSSAKPPVLAGTISPSPAVLLTPSLSPCPVCGNNELDGGETCEDGNTNSGDGCSPDCQDEGCVNDTPGYPEVALCDDGNVCTVDSCNVAAHRCDRVSSCEDGIPCTVDTCEGDTCVHTPDDSICNAVNPCALGVCSASSGCVFVPRSGPCDDGLFCNGTDSCDQGSCSVHTGDPCIGGGECRDQCSEAFKSCVAPDGSPCTADSNPCTSDVCNGAGSCIHPPSTDPCDDGIFCNGLDFCLGGNCVVHTGDPCVGLGECQDLCDEALGTCQSLPNTPCTDDGNVCTEDMCDGNGGCMHLAQSVFERNSVAVTRRGGSDNDKLLVKSVFSLADLSGDPSETGVRLDVRGSSGEPVYDSYLPPESIVNVKGASVVFRFKDRDGTVPGANGVNVAIFKRIQSRGIVRVKMRGRNYDVPAIVGQAAVTASMLFGEDAAVDDCIASVALECRASNRKVSCEQ